MNDEFGSVIAFRDAFVDILEHIQSAAQCVIPVNDNDKSFINKGIESLEGYINSLKNAETLKDINKYIDVPEYLKRGPDDRTIDYQAIDKSYRGFVSAILNETSHE